MNNTPKTLQEAITYFSVPSNCVAYVRDRRWPNGVACPACGSTDVRFYESVGRWECKNKHPKRQFSVKNGTIFEDSPIGLDKWLVAMWLIVNCKNGISSYEIGRALGITQKSAWFLDHRIRLALQSKSFSQLGGKSKEIEADEAFIGGAARFMHKARRQRVITSTGPHAKAAVFGILERGGEIRTTVIANRRKHTLRSEIIKHVKEDTPIFTDALMSYDGLRARYQHEVIDHAHGYVRGRVHTNGLENFWSLLKRTIKGTYVSVEPFHLFRYLDEQTFRYNNRDVNDASRFERALRHIVGRRVTYKQLIAKEA